MILQRFIKYSPIVKTPRFISKPIIQIGAKVRIANLRKSKSIGTIVGHSLDDVAPRSTKNTILNWRVKMEHDNVIMNVNAKGILKVIV